MFQKKMLWTVLNERAADSLNETSDEEQNQRSWCRSASRSSLDDTFLPLTWFGFRIIVGIDGSHLGADCRCRHRREGSGCRTRRGWTRHANGAMDHVFRVEHRFLECDDLVESRIVAASLLDVDELGELNADARLVVLEESCSWNPSFAPSVALYEDDEVATLGFWDVLAFAPESAKALLDCGVAVLGGIDVLGTKHRVPASRTIRLCKHQQSCKLRANSIVQSTYRA